MNKILIFGLPRTATTVFQQQVAQLFNVENLSEPFCGDNNISDWYKWAKQQENCVMKVTSTNLYQYKDLNVNIYDLYKQGKFTHLVITQRKNLTDCCASLFYAERVLKKYHFTHNEQPRRVRFSVDDEFLNFWLIGLKEYYQNLNMLRKNSIHCELLDYDLYTQCIPQKIFDQAIIPTGYTQFARHEIKYDRLCVNYQEITTTIDNYVKRLQH